MGITFIELSHLLLCLSILLTFAHGFGYLFKILKWPQVIGEIVGGIALGPSCLKILSPEFYTYLFQSSSFTNTGMTLLYQLGLLLLMYCSGMEMRTKFVGNERRISFLIAIIGTLIPLIFSYFIADELPLPLLMGEKQNSIALILIFSASLAITSIPIISRILLDLSLLNTKFSRIILSSAVLEDILLYMIVALALSYSSSKEEILFGLPTILNLQPATPPYFIYHLGVTLFMIGPAIYLGKRVYKLLDQSRFNYPRKQNQLAFFLLFLFAITTFSAFLGVAPMLGAFIAGVATKYRDEEGRITHTHIKNFSFAFFIPLYFALIGVRLDFVHSLNLPFFLALFFGASLIKMGSVFVACKVAKLPTPLSFHFGMAMNARGGPGIVLASIAKDAEIISDQFFVALVLLAITTSMIAGKWLALFREKVLDDQFSSNISIK